MSDKKPLVTHLKEFISKNYNLAYNEVSRVVELDGVPINDITLNSIFIESKEECPGATKDVVCSIIYSNWLPSFNPFLEFVESHKNEVGHGAIDRLIASIETDTPNYELFIKKWLCSLMASIHGKHSPLMLVLCGGQNTGKTEWFRRLLPIKLSPYYAESKLDGGKDDEILMTKKLIIVDDEMGGKSKQENKKLKEMTSKQTFSIREPYGRVSVDLTRLAMLCGTTNDTQIINDPTGNRRILPINVIGINHSLYNSVDKAELFIELYNLYQSGYDYNLSNDEIKLLNESTTDFEVSSTEEEMVSRYYALPSVNDESVKEVSNTDIVSRIKTWSGLNVSPTKLGMVLKKMGYEQKVVKRGHSSIRAYKVIELSP